MKPSSHSTTLSLRALNRATLARQMLLKREKTPVLGAIERLAGLQAQLARPPFIGLWTRIEDFKREELTRLIQRRKVVRATMMRGTLHLMSTKDYLQWRAAIQPVLTGGMRSILRERADFELGGLIATARAHFLEAPRTFDALRDHLLKLHPQGDERAMAYAVRMNLPLIQIPTDDAVWAYPGKADFTVAESWLSKPLGGGSTPHALALRYFAAFGPATASDAQTWSGLSGLREVIEDLRPKLKTFRDERGRELFDLPKAPRPPEDTPAPARFLPDYDNLLLAHSDRARIIADEYRPRVATANLAILPTFLVDGFVAGTWKIERKKTAATILITPFAALRRKEKEELVGEAEKLIRFVEEDARTATVDFRL